MQIKYFPMKSYLAAAVALFILQAVPLLAQNLSAMAKETPAEKFEREQLGNVPVALHGRVVDQANQPLDGVVVRLELRVGYMRTPTEGHTRWDIVELTTNPNGLFTLANRKAGHVNVVGLEKSGYEPSSKNPKIFGFAASNLPRHVPDPQKPVVFRMYKLLGAEPMIFVRQTGGIPCDGTSTNFDAFTGLRTSSNHNFKVTFTRVPLHPTKGQRYDNTLKLEIIGGGILATDDEFTYLAPEEGYEPSVTIERKAGDPAWDRYITRCFYFKTKEGYYGRMKVELATFFEPPPTQFGYESWINPSGSRVLEYDPLKRAIPGKLKSK